MSLGFSPVYINQNLVDKVKVAMKEAIAKGLIVISAAGNFTMNVNVYPAAFRDVISMAACGYYDETHDAVPWIGSAFGDHVDFIAPGHDVWGLKLKRPLGEDKLDPGITHGTSYAAAYTAGIAALWIERHEGHAEILRKLQTLNSEWDITVTVQDLFRQALMYSTSGTNRRLNLAASLTGGYGYGLINGLRALELSLQELFTLVRRS
jgi:subtilisin family serine protease